MAKNNLAALRSSYGFSGPEGAMFDEMNQPVNTLSHLINNDSISAMGMPQNYIQRTGGPVIDLGPSYVPQQAQQTQPRRTTSAELAQRAILARRTPEQAQATAQRFLMDNPQFANQPGFSEQELSSSMADTTFADILAQRAKQASVEEQSMIEKPSDRLARERFEWEKAGGNTNKAPIGYRFDQSGGLEAIPGGPVDIKSQTKIAGRGGVDSQISTMADYYRRLKELGAITSTQQGSFGNIGARISSSDIGQFAGGSVGTEAQSIRDSINMQRPLLLQMIKEATGMSAQQMNSNAEMQMYLKAATDPKLGYEANIRALNKISELYGIGGDAGTNKAAMQQQSIPKTGEAQDGYIFLGGNPADPARWRNQ